MTKEDKLLNEFIAIGLDRYPEALSTIDKFREEIQNLLISVCSNELENAGVNLSDTKFEPSRGADWITVFATVQKAKSRLPRLEVGIKWEKHETGPAKLLFRAHDCPEKFDALTEYKYPKPIKEWYRDGKKQSVHLCWPLKQEDYAHFKDRLKSLVASCLKPILC